MSFEFDYSLMKYLIQGEGFRDSEGPAGFESTSDHRTGGARWCGSQTERILEF